MKKSIVYLGVKNDGKKIYGYMKYQFCPYVPELELKCKRLLTK